MPQSRISPFAETESLGESIIRLLEGEGYELFAGPEQEEGEIMEQPSWMPPMDIFEDDTEYIVKAELPDVDEKDVELKIANNVLTIQGRKRIEHEDDKEHYRLVESSYGEFSRSFSLPAGVAGERAKASFEKGVLKIVLPKKAGAKPKHVSIKLS